MSYETSERPAFGPCVDAVVQEGIRAPHCTNVQPFHRTGAHTILPPVDVKGGTEMLD